jgi:hypothetical protein
VSFLPAIKSVHPQNEVFCFRQNFSWEQEISLYSNWILSYSDLKEMIMAMSSRVSYRWMVASRCIAAIFGGYAFATACTVFLSLALPGPRADVVLFASLLSYVFYLLAVLWVFAAKTAWRAWLWLLLPTLVLTTISYLIKRAMI